MTDYVERQAAVKIAERYGLNNGSVLGAHSGIADCIAYEIENLPPYDTARVRSDLKQAEKGNRYAYWKPVRESEISGFNPELAGRDPIGDYVCSGCGHDATLDCNDKFVLSPYCPWCGRKMKF